MRLVGSMAWGGERGVVVVDVWRRCVVAALPAHALYLPHPDQPQPHQPHQPHQPRHERRSPDLDQVTAAQRPRGHRYSTLGLATR